MTAALQEPFQQELGWGVQERLLAVWGTDVLGRADWSGVFYFLERERKCFTKREDKQKSLKVAEKCVCTAPTMSLGLTRKSLFPPIGMCFFIRLK